jgi:hypothetical protein
MQFPVAESHIRRVDEAVALINATLEFNSENIPKGEVELYHHVMMVRNHKPTKKEGVDAPIIDTPFHAYTGNTRSFRNHKLVPYGSVVTVMRSKAQLRKAKSGSGIWNPTRGEYGIVLGPAGMEGPSRRVFLFSSERVNLRRVCERVQSVQAIQLLPKLWLKSNKTDIDIAQLSQNEMDNNYINLKAENNSRGCELGVKPLQENENDRAGQNSLPPPSDLGDDANASELEQTTESPSSGTDQVEDDQGMKESAIDSVVVEEQRKRAFEVGDRVEAPYQKSRRRFMAVVTAVKGELLDCSYYSFTSKGTQIPITNTDRAMLISGDSGAVGTGIPSRQNQ